VIRHGSRLVTRLTASALHAYAAQERKGGARERMRIERNAQVTGASQSDEPANTDSPPTLGTQNGTGLDNDQTQPSTEQLLADQFLMDPAGAEALAAQVWSSPENRGQRIAALQEPSRAEPTGSHPSKPRKQSFLKGKSGMAMRPRRGVPPRTTSGQPPSAVPTWFVIRPTRTYVSVKASLTFCKSETAENGLGK
jgi:hypothetical protein